MSVSAALRRARDLRAIFVNPSLALPEAADRPETAQAVAVADPRTFFGVFNTASLTTTGTAIVAAPKPGGCLILTDLILNTDQTNTTVCKVRFNDGTRTQTIISGNLTNAPIQIAIPFSGQWRGWKNARLELVLTGGSNPRATLSAGYVQSDLAEDYDTWVARR